MLCLQTAPLSLSLESFAVLSVSNPKNHKLPPSSASIRIDFSQPIGQIGLGQWEPNFTGTVLEVYSALNVLLESAAMETGPTGGSYAPYRGILRATNDISYAVARVASSSDIFAMGNFAFCPAS